MAAPLLLLALLLPASPQGQPAAGPPARVERSLERLAASLAGAGFAGEAGRCLLLLRDLGGGEDLEDLEETVRRPTRARVPRLLRDCRRTAEVLAAAAERAEGEARERLARAALVLDGELAAAHRLLGHEEGADGTWLDPEEAARAARRRKILGTLGGLRERRFDVRPVEPLDPTLQTLAGEEVHAVEFEWLRLEAPLPVPALEAVLQQTLRALAFSRWLLEERLEPAVHEGWVVLLPERRQYQAFLDAAVASGRISAAEAARWWQAHGATLEARGDRRRLHAGLVTWSTPRRLPAEILLLFDAALPVWQPFREDPPVPPWFVAGHVHLVGELVAGAGLGLWSRGGTVGSRRSGPDRLLRSGYRGGLAWLRQQVLVASDPALTDCQLDWFGAYQDEALIKVASVVELLHEQGQGGAFVERYARLTRQRQPQGGGATRRAEAALGRSLPDLDREWRRWLLGRGQRSVAGRLREFLEAESAGDLAMLLEKLNRLRRQAGLEDVVWNPVLTRGALAHARYLAALPREERTGPGARREDPDRPGWTPEGAEAAARCLVGVGQAEECLQEWLGTVYGRSALLHPGLLAVGAAQVDELCVLDASSLVERGGRALLLWPGDGMEGLPLRKAPEWPEPVPGRDDARSLGLPVTLVLGAGRWGEAVRMRLLRLEGGEEVPVKAFLVTPWSAEQPELAPEGLYALVPARPLEPGTRYRVRVQVGGEELEATFRTRP